MAFSTACAGVRYSTPRSCFVKPAYVEAPRQVIGFDLSPKGEKSRALHSLDYEDGDNNDNDEVNRVDPRSNCSIANSISSRAAAPKSSNSSTTATSPRSALQQLLLCPVDQQSEPARSSPAAKQSLTGGVQTSTTPYVERDAVSAAAHAGRNWPILQGIAELVGPSRCVRSTIHDHGRRHDSPSRAAVSAIKRAAGVHGERSGWVAATIHERPRNSNVDRSSWSNIEDHQLHAELPPCRENSKKNSCMKEVMINVERSNPPHEKSSNVEISRKQATEQSKKSSLFMLGGASFPAAHDHTKQYPLHGAGCHNMQDMDFLNSCYLCKRLLGDGQDAFMYSGDKAFCSMECRYQQIVIDERKERRDAPPVIRSGAASPVYQSYMTAAGATASASASAASSAIATTHNPILINRRNFMINPTAAA